MPNGDREIVAVDVVYNNEGEIIYGTVAPISKYEKPSSSLIDDPFHNPNVGRLFTFELNENGNYTVTEISIGDRVDHLDWGTTPSIIERARVDGIPAAILAYELTPEELTQNLSAYIVENNDRYKFVISGQETTRNSTLDKTIMAGEEISYLSLVDTLERSEASLRAERPDPKRTNREPHQYFSNVNPEIWNLGQQAKEILREIDIEKGEIETPKSQAVKAPLSIKDTEGRNR